MDESNASSNAGSSTTIRLTQYSKGGGCGCKIAPRALENILRQSYCAPTSALPETQSTHEKQLLVGAETKDDAAAYDTGDGYAILTTTDFFMPIVDDPFTFGEIAAANAMSDVYAMGGTPLMAISILGWPLKKLPKELAGQVIAGGRSMCKKAGIPLAGGHSIDTEEPIFGLAVTGRVPVSNLKRNSTALSGNRLFLTKPLGIGLITTAEKRGKVKVEDGDKAKDTMRQLNSVGGVLAQLEEVTAMTDVTGFGLLGHLLEMCEGSGLRAVLHMPAVPLLPGVEEYFRAGCVPGGTQRNFQSYGHKIATKNGEPLTDWQKTILCDPQTSGGLLVAIASEEAEKKAHELIKQIHPTSQLYPIGYMERTLEPSEAVSVILDVTSGYH